MTNTKIKIRIKIDPSAQQTTSDWSNPESEAVSTLPVEDEQIYDWQKIVLIACLLLLIISGLVWFISATWFNDEIDPQSPAPEFPSIAEVPTLAQIEHDIMLPESAAGQTGSSTKIDAATDSEITETLPLADEAPSTPLEHISPTPIPQPIPTAKSLSYSKDTEMLEASNTFAYQPHAAGVSRAQLTSAINRREPVDDIRKISLAGQPSRPIFLFLHLRDLTGEIIQVDWFFQNRPIAKVLLKVGNHDWRTYSSKILNTRRLGNWRVTAQDSSGNLLAEFPFEVTR